MHKEDGPHLNYFDLGLYNGVELAWMIEDILPSLGMFNLSVYGFEACKKYYENLRRKYAAIPYIGIYHLAITDSNRLIKLYHAPNYVGHSVFSTKNNVSHGDFEFVQGILFSTWLEKNVPILKDCFNILKVNIEGAEWHLFNDLASNNLVKHFHVFCGAGHDVEKIGELDGEIDNYYALLKKNDIVLHRFTEHHKKQNADMKFIIASKYSEMTKK